MSNAATRTSAQELSDWFYGLQMTVKVMEGLMTEYESGTRDKADYEARFNANAHLLAENLKNVKPLTEKLLSDGYSKYGRSECLDTESDVHTATSVPMANES
jgi:hypothetical protein